MDRQTIAIVGSETLAGREVREVLREAGIDARIELVSGAAEPGSLIAEEGGEAVVISALESAVVADARILVLCGSPESGRRALAQAAARKNSPRLVDVGGALEDEPSARLRAPMVESSGLLIAPGMQVIAHPAAIALALFLKKLAEAQEIRRVVAAIFEPASERGQSGLDELQQQTVNLFSFKPLPKRVFDAQASFNILPAWGADAPQSLAEVELRIERHLATLLGLNSPVPMPSLRLVQAPVFHGYSFSVWVRFTGPPNVETIASELSSTHIDVRSGDQEPPSNAGVAGQGGITVGSIAADRNDPQACWFWMVADNLRIAAENCVEVIRELVD
ncbi:MAG: Asd/ArgC dimerization domain-containing protein [Bryobacteraceae bacterium]